MLGKRFMDEIGAGLVFQAGHENTYAAKSAFCERIDQGINGGRLGAVKHRTVENQSRHLLAAGAAVNAIAGRGFGGRWNFCLFQQMLAITEKFRGVEVAAGHEILAQALAILERQI